METVNPFLTAADLVLLPKGTECPPAELAAGTESICRQRMSFGSGLDYNVDTNTFFGISDRGGNVGCSNLASTLGFQVPKFAPHFSSFKLSFDGTAVPITHVYERTTDGTPVDGLPVRLLTTTYDDYGTQSYSNGTCSATLLPFSKKGFDSEGIKILPNGYFAICDEYMPSVYIVDSNGYVKVRYVPAGSESVLSGADYPVVGILPASFFNRRRNRGFEGIAVDCAGTVLYAFVQSPLWAGAPSVTSARIGRVAKLDITNPLNAVLMAEYLHEFDAISTITTGGGSQTDLKVGDAAFIETNKILIEVHSNTAHKLIVLDFSSATDVKGRTDENSRAYELNVTCTNLASYGITCASKTAVWDSRWMPAGLFPEKTEGLAILSRSVIALGNDNDYGNTAELKNSSIWIIQLNTTIASHENFLCSRTLAGSFGDPHIKTLGGMIVTYTGEGDVTMLEAPSTGLRYQNRFHAPVRAPASWTTAAALQCHANADVVEIYAVASDKADADIRINKKPAQWLEIGDKLEGESFTVRRTGGGRYLVACNDDALTLDITIRRKQEEYAWMDVMARPGRQLLDKAAGLLGSHDSDSHNDVAFSTGKVVELSTASKEAGYTSFMENSDIHEVEASWRLAPESSLFSEAHPISNFGAKRALLEAASESFLFTDSPRMERARTICMKAGLTGAYVQTCAYDLAVTGDEAHIDHHLSIMRS
eukprot:CAMPEP_0184665876 /NCGR_PEP_ID=MMETSP0308-20130426/59131_1 /TAXON_ID=38269 /ORGANISM="Gloeochaete witrockiana, Strain SAG 46.84" /LENGTH=706 /DNA_ID=CAMNT_0027110149 /DNA_START=39 /DNA_END=2159 /DNA_ORIENTATION=-